MIKRILFLYAILLSPLLLFTGASKSGELTSIHQNRDFWWRVLKKQNNQVDIHIYEKLENPSGIPFIIPLPNYDNKYHIHLLGPVKYGMSTSVPEIYTFVETCTAQCCNGALCWGHLENFRAYKNQEEIKIGDSDMQKYNNSKVLAINPRFLQIAVQNHKDLQYIYILNLKLQDKVLNIEEKCKIRLNTISSSNPSKEAFFETFFAFSNMNDEYAVCRYYTFNGSQDNEYYIQKYNSQTNAVSAKHNGYFPKNSHHLFFSFPNAINGFPTLYALSVKNSKISKDFEHVLDSCYGLRNISSNYIDGDVSKKDQSLDLNNYTSGQSYRSWVQLLWNYKKIIGGSLFAVLLAALLYKMYPHINSYYERL